MISLLDKYLSFAFIKKLGGIIIAFLAVFIVVDVIDNIDKFIDSDMPLYEIMRYYILTVPWFVSMGTPMAILLSSVLTFSMMQKDHEITAIKASGISIFRLSIPMLIIGLIVSISIFFFDNKLVSSSLQSRQAIEDKFFPQNTKNTIKRNIIRQIGPHETLSIKRFDHREDIAYNASIQKTDGKSLISRMDIPSMIYTNGLWKIDTYTQRIFYKKNKYSYSAKSDTSIKIDIDPTTIIQKTIKPQEMNFWDLQKFVKRIKNNGINDPRWEVNLHFKTAFAFSSFLMVLFGISLSIRKPRSNAMIGIGYSILVIFLYYVIIKLGQVLGYSGAMSPFLSVWMANILFFFVGAGLLLKTRT